MTTHKAALTRISRGSLATLALAAITGGVGCREEARSEPPPPVVEHAVDPQLPLEPASPGFASCPPGFHESVGSFGTLGTTCELDTAPAEPDSGGCAPGWSWVDLGVVGRAPSEKPVMVCKPPLPPARCADGQRVDTETGECVAVGNACPSAGQWPTELPTGSVLYVRSGAAGTGTQASPLGTLEAALARAKSDDTIVLAAGTYKGGFVIDRKLSIVGICPAKVIIEGTISTKIASDQDPASIEGALDVVAGGDLTLRDVTVRGQRHGLHLQPTAVATVSGVYFDQNTDRAILVQGGTLTLSDAVVERTLPRIDGTRGRGLQVNFAGSAEATDVTFQDNDRGEVTAFTAGSSIALKDCLLQNTRTDGDGYGIIAAEGAQVRAATTAVQRKKGRGVHVVDGGSLTLTQSSVSNIVADASGHGWGAYVGTKGSLSAESTALHHTLGFGIMAEHEGTRLSLMDSTVALATSDLVENAYGRAIGVQDGAQATLDTVRVATNSETGLHVTNAEVTAQDLSLQSNEEFGALVQLGGRLEITRFSSTADVGVAVVARSGGVLIVRDARIEDPHETLGSAGSTLGMALMAQDADVTLERVRVSRSQGIGVSVTGSTVDATGLVIEDTLSMPGTRELGVGLFLEGGEVSVHGVVVRRALMGGIFVGREPADTPTPETMLSGGDVVIQEIAGQQKDGVNGVGLMLGAGANAMLQRVRVFGAHSAGFVAQYGGEANFEDLRIDDTELGQGTDAVGYGMYVAAASHVTLKRGRVQGSYGAGVLLNGNGASLDAVDLIVNRSVPIAEADGVGLRVVGGAAAKLRSSAIFESHAVGVLLQFAGVLDAEDLSVSTVIGGALTSEDAFGSQRIEAVGHCLLATARSNVSLFSTSFDGCPELGALFDDSEGMLSNVEIDGSAVGIAIQGFPEPMVQWQQLGLINNDTPLRYRESDFPVPVSPPPALNPASPSASVVRTE